MDVDSFENPLGDVGGRGALADVEAALACGGAEVSHAAVGAMAQLLAERDAKARTDVRAEMVAMIAEAQLGGGRDHPAAAHSLALRSIVAHLSASPANFHQSVIYYAASADPEDADMRAKAPLLYFGSLLMALMQIATTIGVYSGTFHPSCSSSIQCGTGTWCKTDQCAYCGDSIPLLQEVEGECVYELNRYGGESTVEDAACFTYNNPRDPNYVRFNKTAIAEICGEPAARMGTSEGGRGEPELYPLADVASWCESCVHPIDGVVDGFTQPSLIVLNIGAMIPLDILALVFTVFFVACTVVGELKDIEMCRVAAVHNSEKLSQGWRFALLFVQCIRRWTFLPFLLFSVPLMLMYKGADTLSICFNTVAILFLCEVDNIAFTLGLSERVRARVVAVGRVELSDNEAKSLVQTKTVHVGLFMVFVPGSVWFAHYTATFGACLVAGVPLWVGGVVEAFKTGAPCETGRRVGAALAQMAFGFVFGFVFLLAFS